MNNLDLIIDGNVQTTLHDFIKANTNQETGECSIDKEDISAIRMLFADQCHYIPCGNTWCQVKRIVNLKAFVPRHRQPAMEEMSTAEGAYIFLLENPEY